MRFEVKMGVRRWGGGQGDKKEGGGIAWRGGGDNEEEGKEADCYGKGK